MHFALSMMHLTLHSAKVSSLLEAISIISFSPILHTTLGSNPAKASLHNHLFFKIFLQTINTRISCYSIDCLAKLSCNLRSSLLLRISVQLKSISIPHIARSSNNSLFRHNVRINIQLIVQNLKKYIAYLSS